MPRPKIHDETVRVRLLEEAGRLLAEDGPEALSLRRLAAEVGTSTTAVYSLFGGKPELVREIHREAFRRFGARLAEVRRTDDPLRDLAELATAYRDYALANPHLYTVMFGRPVPDAELDPQDAAESDATFQPLLDIVRAAADAGLLVDVPAETIATGLWAVVHGLMSLELNCAVGPENYSVVISSAMRGWLRDPNASP